MTLLNHNGTICAEDSVHISPNNRSFKYGEGCFETMKMINGNVPLADIHFDRLFASLKTLQFRVPEHFSREYLHRQICELAAANKYTDFAKIRLTAYRGEGSLHNIENNFPNFIIQSWKGSQESNKFNETGYNIDFYPDAKKSCDIFSSLKSNNYLPYAMAAMWAVNNKLDDSIVLNCYNRIADATIANVFIDGDGVVGQQPVMEPGEHFEYVSGCELRTEFGKMSGKYIMENLNTKTTFEVNIPPFEMIVPFRMN